MNGRFQTSPARAQFWSATPEAAGRRLAAAFALSCLLHAAIVFLPFLGMSVAETHTAQAGRQALPATLDATLVPDGGGRPREPAQTARTQPLVADGQAAQTQPRSQQRAQGLGLLPVPAQEYYTTDQLTRRPQPLAVAELDSPELKPFVATGKLVLRLRIDPRGTVVEVAVEKTELPEVFARTAIAGFLGLRFQPGEVNGRPVGALMRIEVTYDDSRIPRFIQISDPAGPPGLPK